MAKNKNPFVLLSERDLNILRGKAIAGVTTPEDTLTVLNHLTALESRLDEADYDDALGTDGWRHYVGMPEDGR